VAYDPNTGEAGVAVQSKFFAVGSVVPWARADLGAIASQAYGNPTFGPHGLDLLASGLAPEQVLTQLLAEDPDRERRQIGMVAASGLALTYTGSECMSWAGGRTGTAPDGVVYSVQGNILTGPEVVDAMARAMENPAGAGLALTPVEASAAQVPDLAGRMLLALLAGEAAGGDSRGMQSSALLVCQAGAGYGGYNDVKYDLRVDDAVDPFAELARLLNLARPIVLANEGYLKLYAKEFATAIAIFEQLVALEPDVATHHYNLACAYSLNSRTEDALRELAVALMADELLRQAAASDPDLAPLRELPLFKELVPPAVKQPGQPAG
jgi:uncharacterized Ntn-hydrolase superfamily protein